jgi:hypothetical protein
MNSEPATFANRVERIEAIRAYHRGTRNAGFVACLVGALIMIAGRFAPGAPIWLVSVGVSIIVFGWGLFAFALIKRAAYARAHALETNG